MHGQVDQYHVLCEIDDPDKTHSPTMDGDFQYYYSPILLIIYQLVEIAM